MNEKYYRLYERNEEFNINTLNAVVFAAEQNRLFSKYSKLIANNKEMFIYWYKQAHRKMGEDMVLIALLAIKADLAKEQSILTVSEILENNVTAENKRNFDLFYSSPYHVRVNAANNTHYYEESSIYNKWGDYLIYENSLNYHDVSNVYAEIIDTEIVNYRSKTSVADTFEERTAQLSKDILYKSNFYVTVNVLSYRLKKLHGIEYNLYNSTDNDTINYCINYSWKMRRRVKGRKYTLIDEYTENVDVIEQADLKQLVYYNQNSIANLLLRNIAMYGLNIPLDLAQKIFRHYHGIIDSLRMITIMGFNLSIKLTYALDEIQMLTLIFTGVLVNSITGTELSRNLYVIWHAHVTLDTVTRFSPLRLYIPDHYDELPAVQLVNGYMLYLPVHARIANKVMLYIRGRISATTLMSYFAVNNYCLIINKQILSWEEANLHDIMDTLELLWSRTGDNLYLNYQDISIFGDWSQREETEKYSLNMELRDVANLLHLDNNALAEKKNIANIYNRADILRIAYGKENYFRRNSYIRGDGQIYNLNAKNDLHFLTPTEMAQAIELSATEKADVTMLSIIDAFDLLNNPDLWLTFKQDLNLDWSISKIANI